MIHKDVGAQQSNNMLLKLEEDAEVAYNDYEKAVKAEDRAHGYVLKVRCLKLIKELLRNSIILSEKPFKMEQHRKMLWTKSLYENRLVFMSKNMNSGRKHDGKNRRFMKNGLNAGIHINKMYLKGAKNATIKYILMESTIQSGGLACPGKVFCRLPLYFIIHLL